MYLDCIQKSSYIELSSSDFGKVKKESKKEIYVDNRNIGNFSLYDDSRFSGIWNCNYRNGWSICVAIRKKQVICAKIYILYAELLKKIKLYAMVEL